MGILHYICNINLLIQLEITAIWEAKVHLLILLFLSNIHVKVRFFSIYYWLLLHISDLKSYWQMIKRGIKNHQCYNSTSNAWKCSSSWTLLESWEFTSFKYSPFLWPSSINKWQFDSSFPLFSFSYFFFSLP